MRRTNPGNQRAATARGLFKICAPERQAEKPVRKQPAHENPERQKRQEIRQAPIIRELRRRRRQQAAGRQAAGRQTGRTGRQ